LRHTKSEQVMREIPVEIIVEAVEHLFIEANIHLSQNVVMRWKGQFHRKNRLSEKMS
jgi:hypothetical protein